MKRAAGAGSSAERSSEDVLEGARSSQDALEGARSPDALERTRAERRALLRDAVAIAVVYAAVCAGARAAGFDHVSDDDFSRVTIAQSFAHAPRLDPSGTSWLPFPFWILGTVMAVLGRSLLVARGASIFLAAAAATTPYLVMRSLGIPRGRALLATAFAFGTPWLVWVGAATVPESFTASLTAAGILGLAAFRPNEHGKRSASRRALLSALAIAVACLSRYEPWPVAAVLAATLAVRAVGTVRARRPLVAGLALACVIGPLLWMAWNAHAHDGPLHFFRRVSSFKRAIGDGATDTLDALLLYPGLLVTTRPELAIPVVFLLPSLRDPLVRRRWGIPLLCAAAQVAFLAYGNARDGAPAHHPERALLGTIVVLALFAVDVGMTKLRELATDGRALAAKAGAAFFGIAWVISSVRGAEPPGRGPTEDRSEQIVRGAKLRADGTKALVVTPCAFEHFALVAAYGAPENVEVKPRTGELPSSGCPGVEVR